MVRSKDAHILVKGVRNCADWELETQLAAALAEVAMKQPVTAEDVAEVVASWTGIPLTRLTETESSRLLQLEQRLHKRVIG